MKRIIITLFTLLMFSGVNFAAFQAVSTQQNVETVSASQEISNQQTTTDTTATDKGTVAIILAVVSVLLLPFGLHNWYLGRTKQALWQTLLVIPGFILIVPPLISWIWQIIDLVKLIMNGGSL